MGKDVYGIFLIERLIINFESAHLHSQTFAIFRSNDESDHIPPFSNTNHLRKRHLLISHIRNNQEVSHTKSDVLSEPVQEDNYKCPNQ